MLYFLLTGGVLCALYGVEPTFNKSEVDYFALTKPV